MTQYLFERSETNPYNFVFKTNYELVYEIKFKHTPYIFVNEPDFAEDIYELSIILAEGSPIKTPPDPAIAQTVLAICMAFIDQMGHPIFLFICDSHDGRQAVRARTFTRWFQDSEVKGIAKFDGQFPDENGINIYISFMIPSNHPYYREAVVAFTDLIAAYKQAK